MTCQRPVNDLSTNRKRINEWDVACAGLYSFIRSLFVDRQPALVAAGDWLMSQIYPRLSDDGVVWLVNRCQGGAASKDEANTLAWWIRGWFYKKFLREGYAPEDAEDRAGKAFERTWQAIQQGRFQFEASPSC